MWPSNTFLYSTISKPNEICSFNEQLGNGSLSLPLGSYRKLLGLNEYARQMSAWE